MDFNQNLFLCLLTAHLIGDFVLQADRDVERKREIWFLLKHAIILAVLSYVLAGLWTAWLIPIVIGITHGVIDWIKMCLDTKLKNRVWIFTVEQLMHICILFGLSFGFSKWGYLQLIWIDLFGNFFIKVLVVVSGLITVVKMGGLIVGILIEPYYAQMNEQCTEIAGLGLEKGGRIIGSLERGLIFFFVMIGRPEAVGFLVAAKSIFRFGELKDRDNRMEAEYILIGTLISFS